MVESATVGLTIFVDASSEVAACLIDSLGGLVGAGPCCGVSSSVGSFGVFGGDGDGTDSAFAVFCGV